MPLLITLGLGAVGDGSKSGLLSTSGLGLATVKNPACLALRIYAIENFATSLKVVMSANLALAGRALDPAYWVITSSTGVPVTVTSVSAFLHVVTLGVTEQTNGAQYTLAPPSEGMNDVYGNHLATGATAQFTGLMSAAPGVAMSRTFDERHLDVIFTEAVVEADALIPTNYTISPTLSVLSVERITDLYYRLTTGPQNLLGAYTVTVQNIRDLAHNPVV